MNGVAERVNGEPSSAEESLRLIQEELRCSICYEQFHQPKLLPCFHTFCTECLKSIVTRNPGVEVPCPTCRSKTGIKKPEDVTNVPNNFLVKRLIEVTELENSQESRVVKCTNCTDDEDAVCHCLDCDRFLGDQCYKAHTLMKKFTKDHRVVSIEDMKSPDCRQLFFRPIYCEWHEQEQVKFYCNSCRDLVCTTCALTVHKPHTITSILDLVGEQKPHIESLLEETKRQIPMYNEALQEVDENEKRLEEKVRDVKSRIRFDVEQRVFTIMKQKGQLFSQLDKLLSEKKKKLMQQREFLEMNLVKVTSACNFTSEILLKGRDVDVLDMKTQMVDRLEKLKTFTNYVEEEAYIGFSPDANEIKVGKIMVSEVSPDKSTIVQISKAEVGKVCRFDITARNAQGTLYYSEVDSLNMECEIICCDGSIIPGRINDNRNGMYCLLFKPTRAGMCKVSIQLQGKEIKNSPLEVFVSQDYANMKFIIKTFHGIGKDEEPLHFPVGVAVNSRGHIAVTDSFSSHVRLLDKEGKFFHQYCCAGCGHLDHPRGISFDKDENITVVDRHNNCIKTFTLNGKVLMEAGKEGEGFGEFKQPMGITVDTMGRVIVADTWNNRIQIFDPSGEHIFEFGALSPSQMNRPEDVAYHMGTFIVADTGNHRLLLFSEDGTYQTKIGQKGNGLVEFDSPCGLTVDANGYILVVDSGNHRIQVLLVDGTPVTQFGYHGHEGEGLDTPKNICLSREGDIVVSDCGNHCIKVFSAVE